MLVEDIKLIITKLFSWESLHYVLNICFLISASIMRLIYLRISIYCSIHHYNISDKTFAHIWVKTLTWFDTFLSFIFPRRSIIINSWGKLTSQITYFYKTTADFCEKLQESFCFANPHVTKFFNTVKCCHEILSHRQFRFSAQDVASRWFAIVINNES